MLCLSIKRVLCIPSDTFQLIYFLQALAFLLEVGQLFLEEELLLVEVYSLFLHLLTCQIFNVHLVLFQDVLVEMPLFLKLWAFQQLLEISIFTF